MMQDCKFANKSRRFAVRFTFGAPNFNVALGLILAGMLLCASSLRAQSIFGTITGTVTDPSGAIVGSATVTATFVTTNQKFVGKSNDQGIYNLGDLRDGGYRLDVRAPGFNETVLDDLLLNPRQVLREDIQLQVGDIRQKTEVTGQPGLIETDSATISDTVNTRE